ncbi:IS110 family transposase [Streptomyces sp. V1I1]|uniref:IS110 family transposase n=1 Tax=Streptomyces sp. V1I1 TaxID=3042272 RepID=UPI00358E4287
MRIHLGIDVACRASHRATCTDATGEVLISARRFTTTADDLERLWAALPATDDVIVIMEPTRNAWVPLAAWFQNQGATVVLVPPEQSSDLRDHYNKHTKNDRLDSRVLARLSLLHPEGLRPLSDTGPAHPLRRAVRRRSSLVERRTASFYRLDALLELMGPGWGDALGSGAYCKAALAVLQRTGADPHALRRLGPKRLAALLIRHSRGQWREDRAEKIMEAARETLRLWPDGLLDYAELAEDIAACWDGHSPAGSCRPASPGPWRRRRSLGYSRSVRDCCGCPGGHHPAGGCRHTPRNPCRPPHPTQVRGLRGIVHTPGLHRAPTLIPCTSAAFPAYP